MVLEVRNLTFGYDSSKLVIDRWNAKFDRGEVVAVTGPSGRGKSTLMYLLGLMIKPQSGSIKLLDSDTAGLNDRERASLRANLFGFVFQDAVLDPTRTVIDNVAETALYRWENRASAKARGIGLLTHFGVELRANAKPGQVSGGQAQRIALCRALLGNPKIILADEPTGNLDPVSSEVVVNAFRDHADQGGTVIIVTHDPSLISKCDRSIEL